MGRVTVRLARLDDADAVAAMLARCSPETRRRRFHGRVGEITPGHLRRYLLAPEARLAEAGGRVVGLAVLGQPHREPDVRELGVVVEDAWQRRGIGRRLVADLLAHAATQGVRLFRLEMCRLQPDLLDYALSRLPVVSASGEGCDVTIDVAVPAALTAWRAPRSAVGTARRRRWSAARRRGAPART